MQYISSLILEYAPFVGNPDFQLIVSTAMAIYLTIVITKKLIKALYKTLKFGASVATIVAVFYLVLVGNPIENKESAVKYVKNEMPKVIALLKN